MRAAGLVVAATLARVGAAAVPGGDHGRPRRPRRGDDPRRRVPSRRSWATTASPAASAPRSTTEVVHGIPAPDHGAGRGRPALDRLRRDPRRLARRRRGHRLGRRAGARRRRALRGVPRGDVGGDRRGPARRPPRRRLARRRGRGPSPPGPRRALRDRRGLRRPRHRHRDAHGAAPAEPTAAPASGPRLREGMVLADRADAHRGRRGRPRSSTTSGPSSPPTGRGPRTGSTPSR